MMSKSAEWNRAAFIWPMTSESLVCLTEFMRTIFLSVAENSNSKRREMLRSRSTWATKRAMGQPKRTISESRPARGDLVVARV